MLFGWELNIYIGCDGLDFVFGGIVVTIQTVNDLHTPIGEILRLAGSDGVLVQPPGEPPFAVMRLDEDLLDFLIERNAQFIEDCGQIRQRMANGAKRSQAEVDSMFGRK